MTILSESTQCCLITGQSILGFSLASPDLVVCTGSPDIPVNSHGDSSTFLKNEFGKNPAPSIDISLEKGINGLETEGAHETQPAINSTLRHTPNEEVFLEASFELPPPPMAHESLVNEECQEEGPQIPTGETFACAIKYDSPPSKLNILQIDVGNPPTERTMNKCMCLLVYRHRQRWLS